MTMSDRFDAFARRLGSQHSRRAALGMTATGLGAAVAGAAGRDVGAQSTPAAQDGALLFLFVQTASSGTLTPATSAGSEYRLTLEGHHGGTIYFSDRPERIFGDTPTQNFFDVFDFTPVNPPNAALVVETDEGATDVVILELIDPVFDEEAGIINYVATILEEYDGDGLAHVAAQQVDSALPASFGRASLFIDSASSESSQAACFLGPEICTSMGALAPCGPSGTCFCTTGVDGETYCSSGLMLPARTCGACQTNDDCTTHFGSSNYVCIAHDGDCNLCASGGTCAALCA